MIVVKESRDDNLSRIILCLLINYRTANDENEVYLINERLLLLTCRVNDELVRRSTESDLKNLHKGNAQ